MQNKKIQQTKKKRQMRSFEADADVAEMLEAAVQAGRNLTHIMNAALRKHGPDILGEMAKEMREQADALEKKISSSKR